MTARVRIRNIEPSAGETLVVDVPGAAEPVELPPGDAIEFSVWQASLAKLDVKEAPE